MLGGASLAYIVCITFAVLFVKDFSSEYFPVFSAPPAWYHLRYKKWDCRRDSNPVTYSSTQYFLQLLLHIDSKDTDDPPMTQKILYTMLGR